jgi:CBS domain-containing protein
MDVAQILKFKGRDVATVTSSALLIEVAQKLADKRIGAVVVMGGEGKVAGIVSERDIIRRLAEQGPSVLSSSVAQTMTRDVISCRLTDTLDALMAEMTTRRFRHLPVIEDGNLVGIVSIGDVVKHHVAEVEHEAMAMRAYITQN